MSLSNTESTGLLINVLFLSQYKHPNSYVTSHSFLDEPGFQKNTVWEFAIGLVLIISYEPVKVETESRNFSAQFQSKQSVYKLVHVRRQ